MRSKAFLLALVCLCAAPLVADSQRPQQAKPKPDKATLVAARPTRKLPGKQDRDRDQGQEEFSARVRFNGQAAEARARRVPREQRMRRADSFDGDVRTLPQTRGRFMLDRPEREGPAPSPTIAGDGAVPPQDALVAVADAGPVTSVIAPPPLSSFNGLDFATWGNGHPPDTNGDVGPEFFIQTINTSLGVFRKTDGVRVAAFGINAFMSQGHFGNLCDTNNFGDPVVLYDTFEDRWVITDFAFSLDAGGNVVNPPGSFQCFAVSKSGDPLAGGWNYYSVNTTGGLGDYPKFGVWPDGIYMSANMFNYASGGSFQNPRVYAFNKAQMYAGVASIQVVSFDAPAADFTLLPSNARLQAGTPPPGTPNYFLSTWEFLNGLTIYKFHVDWDRVSLSTFTGPDVPISATGWPAASPANAASQGGNALDVLPLRAMMQNQYSNIGGAESLWATHTVRRGNTAGLAAPRWYQVNVTGGTVAAAIPQATTWDPDGANVINRFMPSLAVDRQGDMALGYSTSSSTTKPAIKYAGRLATDPINTFSLTEQVLLQGTGTQLGNCGGSACARWGDYSAMTLDPDGCTFWYTNMYYAVDGLNHQTRIGSFAYPSCTPSVAGGLQGTVTSGATPLAGVTVALGARTTTTDGAGFYSFPSLPAGTYPSVTASLPGYTAQTFTAIVVSDGTTAVRDFSLNAAPTAACLTDTTQADFQRGVPTACDLAGSPGNVTLLDAEKIDQQNLTVTNSGFAVNATTWAGQTFTPAVTGNVTRIDLDLFCSGCTGTTPNLTVSIRATAAGVPTGADLGVGTIAGFSSGAGGFFSALFPTPVALTAGTQYAIVFRATANPSLGTYAYVCSCAGTGTVNSNPYANGLRVTSANSGGTWTADATVGGRDLGFKVFMRTGFAATGTYVSSIKDANPAPGATATWLSIAWNASVPSGTSLQFQVAASNSAGGPFAFVGPDGTPATFFNNGDSLAQFNGQRYLEYKALLNTSNPTATPVLNDVTICYQDVRTVTTLAVDAASGPYGGTTTLTATLSTPGGGLVGRAVTFTLNGASVGTASTSALGVATVSGVSLAGIAAGTYPGGVAASFAGEPGYTPATGANSLTVTQLPQTITFAQPADAVATDPPFTVTATGGDSGNPVIFSTASTACSVSGATVTLNAAGSCAVDADQAGTDNYEAAPRVTRTFNITFAPQAILFAALPDRTATDPPFPLTATGGGSGNPVAFSTASTACSVSGNTVTLLASGICAIDADQAGDARYSAAPRVTLSFSIGLASQTILFGALPGRVATDPPFTVTATGGGSSSPVVFSTASTACSVTGSTVTLLAAGTCAIDADQAADARYAAAPRVTQTFSIAFAPQVILFGALPDRLVTTPPFALTATGGGSGNPVVFSTASTACGVSGNTVTVLTAGICAIDADQAGNARYSAAPRVTRSFSIGLASQTITFPPIAATTYGAADFAPPASASSGLPVVLTASGRCSVLGATVHLTGAGSCSLTASQPGNGTYGPAVSVMRSFAIGLASLSVTADSLVKVLNSPNPVLTGTLTGVVSGDAITATFSTTATTLSPIGSYPIVPALVDPNGRLSNYSVHKTNGVLAVIYAPPGPCFGGPGHQILPPIKADGSSVFKANTRVDVEFRACDARGLPIRTDVVRSFKLVKIVQNGRSRDVSVDLEGDSWDGDRHGRHPHDFRFDPEDLAWEFHLNTRVLDDDGTYFFRITLNDGSAIDFSFTLKKNGRDDDRDRDRH